MPHLICGKPGPLLVSASGSVVGTDFPFRSVCKPGPEDSHNKVTILNRHSELLVCAPLLYFFPRSSHPLRGCGERVTFQ